jgi:hypothetical protein
MTKYLFFLLYVTLATLPYLHLHSYEYIESIVHIALAIVELMANDNNTPGKDDEPPNA